MRPKFHLTYLFFILAAHPADFPESNNDVPPLTSLNDPNNNVENPLDIPLLGLDEVANLSDYKSEDELFPEEDLRAAELADMEEDSEEPITPNTSERALLQNEQKDAGKALFLRVGTCLWANFPKTLLLRFQKTFLFDYSLAYYRQKTHVYTKQQ